MYYKNNSSENRWKQGQFGQILHIYKTNPCKTISSEYQPIHIIRILPRIIIRIYYQELYTLKTLGVCYSLWKMHFLIGSGPLIWIYHRQCVIRVTNLKRCLNHSLYHFHESINNVFASFLISKQLLCLIFNLTSSYFISDYV